MATRVFILFAESWRDQHGSWDRYGGRWTVSCELLPALYSHFPCATSRAILHRPMTFNRLVFLSRQATVKTHIFDEGTHNLEIRTLFPLYHHVDSHFVASVEYS